MESGIEPLKVSYYQIALLGAGLGFILGLIPLVFGFIKGKAKIGILGLLGSTIGGAILGIFLSIPVIGVCLWLILKDSKKSPQEVVVVNENPIEVSTDSFDKN